jgi:hypothetical protein
MSDLNPDTCMLQLEVAKEAIEKNDALVAIMKQETAQKEDEAKTAEDDYKEKKSYTNKQN